MSLRGKRDATHASGTPTATQTAWRKKIEYELSNSLNDVTLDALSTISNPSDNSSAETPRTRWYEVRGRSRARLSDARKPSAAGACCARLSVVVVTQVLSCRPARGPVS